MRPTGGYLTSVLKDLFCVPRPFSPPLVRLSVGTHALEYGFPSTHATNSVSMALYFGGLVARHSTHGAWIDGATYVFLAFFFFTVTFGRLYTGMVSATLVDSKGGWGLGDGGSSSWDPTT